MTCCWSSGPVWVVVVVGPLAGPLFGVGLESSPVSVTADGSGLARPARGRFPKESDPAQGWTGKAEPQAGHTLCRVAGVNLSRLSGSVGGLKLYRQQLRFPLGGTGESAISWRNLPGARSQASRWLVASQRSVQSINAFCYAAIRFGVRFRLSPVQAAVASRTSAADRSGRVKSPRTTPPSSARIPPRPCSRDRWRSWAQCGRRGRRRPSRGCCLRAGRRRRRARRPGAGFGWSLSDRQR